MSRHRWTSADLARARGWQLAQGGGSDAAPNLAPRPNQAPGLNAPHDPLAGATQLERRYAAWLDQEQAAGRVVAWRYEPMRLVLSRGGKGRKGLTYAPDFWVRWGEWQAGRPSPTGRGLEFHEVKPRRKNGEPLWLGDSRTKVLAAAEWLRWSGIPLVLVLPNGDGTWERRVL